MSRDNLIRQRVCLRQQLQQNRQLMLGRINDADKVFPRSIIIQNILQKKSSKIIPIIHLSLAGLRLFRLLYGRSNSKT